MKRMEDLACRVRYLTAERLGANRARETASSLEGDACKQALELLHAFSYAVKTSNGLG